MNKSELEVINQRKEVKKAEGAHFVLENYTQPMELSRLRSAVAQAEQKLARQIKENASMMAQKIADLNEKESTLDLYKRQAKKLQDQIEKCTIRAPEAGLIIYMSSIDRSMSQMIQEGTMVRYSQILMRLPDVRTMKVVLKVQETQKLKLDVSKNQRARVRILGVPRLIDATLTKVALLPDNSQRWWNPDLKEYPVELLLDETPEGLKPGARCEAEIYIDHLSRILTVPMSAIYAAGSDTYVFVRDGDHVKERKVTIGANNETQVQLTSGVSAGESVLLLQAGQGRTLLEKAKIKADEPATRPSPGRFKRESVTGVDKPDSPRKEKGKG
jgi:HlyD family secretion protein